MMHSYHNRSYRTERRRAWPIVLGWVVAIIPFISLLALVFYGEWLIKLAKELQS